MSAVITGKNYFVTKMDRYNKYQTKQYTDRHAFTLHIQQMAASTWPDDHQGRPSAPTNSLHGATCGALSSFILTYLLSHTQQRFTFQRVATHNNVSHTSLLQCTIINYIMFCKT